MTSMLNDHYQDKPEKYFHYARQEMIAFIPEAATTILEVGCGDGAFGAALKQNRSAHITGIEPFADAARIAETRLDKVITGDVEAGLKTIEGQAFDCIVCNDVLEHLIDPWHIVRQLRTHLHPGGHLVASIPNMLHFEVMKDLLIHGTWVYTDQGVLDRTHLRFFTRRTIRSLFESAHLEVIALQGINGGPFPWKFSLLNRLLFNALDDMRWIQFACVSRRTD
jgi:2-polyprenyl-3-methyl-5-hydroxy-6-metoxy-1,4-benzoquinol methylase